MEVSGNNLNLFTMNIRLQLGEISRIFKKNKHDCIRYYLTSVSTRQQKMVVLKFTNKINIKVWATYVTSMSFKELHKVIWRLKRYSKSKHRGARFPCGQCEYKATQMDKLKSHKNIFKAEQIVGVFIRFPFKEFHCLYI
jgi:hypothetical protein